MDEDKKRELLELYWDTSKASLSEMWQQKRRLARAMRLVIERLVPSNAPEEELRRAADALEQYAERLGQTDELNVEVDTGRYDGQLDKQAESVVFAVVEEAVGNAKKHAHANQVLIRLHVTNNLFTAEIRDDGIGFDVAEARLRREAGHLGLLNMEERSELVGGRCSFQSQLGAGTSVRIDIPLRRWDDTG